VEMSGSLVSLNLNPTSLPVWDFCSSPYNRIHREGGDEEDLGGHEKGNQNVRISGSLGSASPARKRRGKQVSHRSRSIESAQIAHIC
jgi:hypothetical protein